MHADRDRLDLVRLARALGRRAGEERIAGRDLPRRALAALPATAVVHVVGRGPQVERAGRGNRERLLIVADPLALDGEAGPEGAAGDPRLRVGERPEDALELIAHARPDPVEAAPGIGQRRRHRHAGQDPGEHDAGSREDDSRPHDGGRHLEVLVHAPPLPAVLPVDQRCPQPEEQCRDDEEQQVAEQVGEGRRQVDDHRRAEQQDRVDHAVVTIDGIARHEGRRPREHAEADGVRRQLRRVPRAQDGDRPTDQVVAQRADARDLAERGMVFPADGPEHDASADDRAQWQGEHHPQRQDAEQRAGDDRPEGDRRQELELVEPMGALHRPREREGHDHEQAEAEPAGARVEDAFAEIRHGIAPCRRSPRRCRRRGGPADARCRTRRARAARRRARLARSRPARHR